MPQIRKARLDDLDDIYEITALAFGPYCIAKLLEDRYGIVDNRTWQEHKAGGVVSSCREHIDSAFVAEEDGKVVGYATFGLNNKEKEGHIGNNAVNPEYQGRGIGTMLIRTVVDHLIDSGSRALFVGTMEHDYSARRVYEKVGFQETERRIHYAKQEGNQVKTVTVGVDDEKSRKDCEKAGFEEIVRSIYYTMEVDKER